MRAAQRFTLFATIALTGIVASTTALGADTRFDSGDPSEFSLYISRLEATLDESSAHIETTTEQIGISWFSRLQPRTDAGFFAGYSVGSQTGSDLTAGMDFSGAHGGLVMRRLLLERNRLDLRLIGRYTYRNIDAEQSAQQVRLSWHQVEAGFGSEIRISPHIGLYGELFYGRITGTETASGTVNQTRSLDYDGRSGGAIGIDFRSGPDGLIALRAYTGINEGAEIRFTRHYH